TADLEAAPLGHVELGSDLDVELERHRTGVRDLDRLEVELRLADRGEELVFAELLEAVHQERAFDLVGHVVAEAIFDQLARGATLAEAGDGRLGDEVREGVIKVTVDVGSRHGDGDVTLAGAG